MLVKTVHNFYEILQRQKIASVTVVVGGGTLISQNGPSSFHQQTAAVAPFGARFFHYSIKSNNNPIRKDFLQYCPRPTRHDKIINLGCQARRRMSSDNSDGIKVEDVRAESQPKITKVRKTDAQLRQELKRLIRKTKVILFMKGSPESPQCGFSRRAVDLLMASGCPDFTYVDVLRSERIRELLKVESGWPTIPQLFIKGEFIGGCDIIAAMFESGELKDLLKKHDAVFEETTPSEKSKTTEEETTKENE